MKGKKKYIFMLFSFVLIVYLTFKKIYDKDSFKIALEGIKSIKPIYLIICLLIISGYFILQGLYMKLILKSLNHKIPLHKGIFYSLVEFYFSGITPSSTGGQPVQLYYMTKDKIPMRKSYITLMLNTIYFKLIMVIMGLIVLIFNNKYVFENDIIYKVFFVLGFVADLLIVIFGFILIFNQKYIRKMLSKILEFCKKFKYLSKLAEKLNVEETTKRYKEEISYIKNHKKMVFLNFVITFIQRLLLFSVAYVIYRSLGFNQHSYLDLLIIQVSVQIAIELVPLPGGAALSENMLHNIFVTLFGIGFANIGMLLTRTFAFYLPLLISGIIIMIYTVFESRFKIVK